MLFEFYKLSKTLLFCLLFSLKITQGTSKQENYSYVKKTTNELFVGSVIRPVVDLEMLILKIKQLISHTLLLRS